MKIKVSQESMEKLRKRGFLGVRFEEKGKDEVIRENGREMLSLVVESKKMDRRKLILLARKIVRTALAKKSKKVVVSLEQFRFKNIKISDGELAELLAVNFVMADYSFQDFLAKPKEGFPRIEELVILAPKNKEVEGGVAKGLIIGQEVNQSRHISTMPGGEMTPEILARHAKSEMKGLPVKVKILGVPEMKKLKMGGVLGVGMGSAALPRFIILEYWGAGKGEKPARNASGAKRNDADGPVVFVGKGVTFDTGGINLKPENYSKDMNMDMSGGAAVIHALAAAARLKLKKNVVVLVPAVENMLSGSSYRPGDILRSMSGKTIEVLNTDAEGRIVLADALHFAKRYHPSLVVDVATLTGAAIGALGERASALFTEDEKLELKMRHLGEESGDYVWPLPLWDEYDEEIKGTFGDVANLGKTRYGGAIHAAAFLKQFVDHAYPWVHLDIAPRMTTLSDEHLAKGSAGAPVRLLVRILEKI